MLFTRAWLIRPDCTARATATRSVLLNDLPRSRAASSSFLFNSSPIDMSIRASSPARAAFDATPASLPTSSTTTDRSRSNECFIPFRNRLSMPTSSLCKSPLRSLVMIAIWRLTRAWACRPRLPTRSSDSRANSRSSVSRSCVSIDARAPRIRSEIPAIDATSSCDSFGPHARIRLARPAACCTCVSVDRSTARLRWASALSTRGPPAAICSSSALRFSSSCTRNCSNARCFDSISSASFFASSGSTSSPEGAEGNGQGAVWRRPHGSPDTEATDGSAPAPAIGSTARERRDRARTRKEGKGVEERMVGALECGRGGWCGRGRVEWPSEG